MMSVPMKFPLQIVENEVGEFVASTQMMSDPALMQKETGEFSTGMPGGIAPMESVGEFNMGSAPQKSGHIGKGSR